MAKTRPVTDENVKRVAKPRKRNPWLVKAPGIPRETLRAFAAFKNPVKTSAYREREAAFSAKADLAGPAPGPASMDWRTSGAVPTPALQGTCNTCTSFATVTVVESLHFLKHHGRIRLAPGFIHTCLLQRACSEGATAEDVLEAAATHGIAYGFSGDYPFPSAQCTATVNLYPISRRVWLAGPNEAMAVLASQGPVVSDMWIDPAFMSLKPAEIYMFQDTPDKRLHSVAVVGYDRDQACWIISNSLGTGWCDGGFGRVAFGSGGLLDQRGGWQILI